MTNHTEDAATMYALIAEQQKDIVNRQGAIVPGITLTWGLAWLIGFGALWLIDGVRPAFSVPLPVAITVFVVVIVAAIAMSAVLGVRSARGIRSNRANSFTGAVYGSTWSLGMLAILGVGLGLSVQGMAPELANYFYPVSFVVFTGIMYVVAGAIWQATPSVVTGLVLVAIGVAATYLPYPWHFLFLAVAGGGTFLVLSVAARAWLRKAAR